MIDKYMIYKCLTLFNLLPTSQPHHWLIAADWLEEENLDVTAAAFREDVFVLKTVKCENYYSCGNSYAYGNGDSGGWGGGSSSGYGDSDGSGYGGHAGHGDGSGHGEG